MRIEKFHRVVADHLAEDGEPEEVTVGIETDRVPRSKPCSRPATPSTRLTRYRRGGRRPCRTSRRRCRAAPSSGTDRHRQIRP